MFLYRRPIYASWLRKASLKLLLGLASMWLAGLAVPNSALAENRKHADKAGEVDTEHMFGFTEGSDIGKAGEKELEVDSTGRFRQLHGSYHNVPPAVQATY